MFCYGIYIYIYISNLHVLIVYNYLSCFSYYNMHIIYIIGRKFQAMAKSGILPTLIGASLSEKTSLPYMALILGILYISVVYRSNTCYVLYYIIYILL